MLKKIAILALAVSAAYSNALAQDECVVTLSGSTVFTGEQIRPVVKKVECGDDEYTEEVLKDFVTYGTNINAGVDAGLVTITLPNGDVVNNKFEIKRKGVRLIADDCEKELGAATPNLTWHYDTKNTDLSSLNADTLQRFESELAKKVKLVVADGVEEVGFKFEINGDPSVDLNKLFPNYNVIVSKGFMTIIKTQITVAVENATKVYGSADPKFEYTITGNIKKDDYGKLGKIELSRNDGENVGKYEIAISVENTDLVDYDVVVVPGSMTITPAAASLSVDNATKVYGSATPEFTYKVTGLVGNDELKDVSLSCAKCLTSGLEKVDEYVITASVNAASNPNYVVTTTNGSLTVTPKAVTVTLLDAEKTYGDKDPNFTYEAEGLVSNGETLKSAKISRDEGEIVGTYKVSLEFAEGANPNYTLTTVPSTLTINQKNVVLSVDDVSKKYGEKDPELTYTVDALASFNGVQDVLKGVSLTREAGEDAGEYAITATVDAKANPNYVIKIAEGGKLTITANNDKIVVTIKGHTKTVEYSGQEQTVNGFDISTNSEAYSLKFVTYTGDSSVSGTDAGKYAMGLSANDFKNTSVNYPNVIFNITDGVLNISPRSVVVKAKSDTITYGDEIPTEFEWVADSLLNGDTLDNIHLSLNKTGRLAAGDYALVFDQKNPSNKNYAVSKYETATLTVLKKIVTVTIADTGKVYSEEDPEQYRYDVDGLLDGDVLNGIKVVREAGDSVRPENGTYRISATFASDDVNPNYTVKIKQGQFKITPYKEQITVGIFGDDISVEVTGEDISVPMSFDVSPLRIPGEPWLPEKYAYSKSFVAYKGAPNVSGKELGRYDMNLSASDFVNLSLNFENVQFRIAKDGSLTIHEPGVSIGSVKAAKAFGLSSMNRCIQVSGSAVGVNFAVLDMQGRIVHKGVVSTTNFEIPVPNAGVYMVRVGATIQKIRVK